MATAAATPVLRMKLLVDTTTQRVVFAEAGKDVVDFLFSLLALPVATAVALVGKDSAAGLVRLFNPAIAPNKMLGMIPGV
ncbi:hypothetical protein EJB05_31470, partial [Eragrostis curvula]